jgi:hypothetical protein
MRASDADVRRLNSMLLSHIVGYSWNVWNEERALRNKPLHTLPVRPSPLNKVLALARKCGVRTGNHKVLYRGFGGATPNAIDGYDPVRKTLTLDRITSFTPDRALAAAEHGPTLCCIEVDDPATAVFADWTACSLEAGCCHASHVCTVRGPCARGHFGDIGIEVQLLPGTYRVRYMNDS